MVLLLLGSLGVVALGVPSAGAAPACQLDERLLDDVLTGSVLDPDLSGDGAWAVFTAGDDLTGENPDGELQVFVLQRSTGALEQLTDVTDDGGFQLTGSPAISADGDRVVFVSNTDLTGSNADLAPEVFLHTRSTGQTVQITDADADAFEFFAQPTISANGGRIAFYGLGDPSTGTDDLDGYFTYEVGSGIAGAGSFTNVADVASIDGIGPSISADGTRVAFQASEDLTGQNPDGDVEAFVTTVGSGTFLQVSQGQGGYRPAISADGSRVVFATDANGLRLRTVGGGVTVVVPDGKAVASSFALDADGSRLVFTAAADLLGGAAPGNERWVHDVPTGASVQLTATGGQAVGGDNAITDAGDLVVISSDVDPLAQGDGPNLYLGSCGDVPPTGFADVSPDHPFASEIQWMADQGISEGYDDGTYRPAANVTRQAMSAFMYRLAGSPTSTPSGTTFTDVSSTHPFYAEIEWMADTGISEGYQPGPTYRPSAAVTRQAMSAFMQRLAEGPGVGTSEPGSG